MNALEKAKLLKQLKGLLNDKSTAQGLAKAKVLKQILELRKQLGFGNSVPATQPQPSSELPGVADLSIFQQVIQGIKALSLEVLTEMIELAEKEPNHPDLVPATQILVDQYNTKLV